MSIFHKKIYNTSIRSSINLSCLRKDILFVHSKPLQMGLNSTLRKEVADLKSRVTFDKFKD